MLPKDARSSQPANSAQRTQGVDAGSQQRLLVPDRGADDPGYRRVHRCMDPRPPTRGVHVQPYRPRVLRA